MKKALSRMIVLGFAALFLAQTPPPAPPAKTSVAVYPIKAAGSAPELAAAMTSLMASVLTHSPKLQVIEEAMLKSVMERQGLNASDACDDSSCQVEIGKLVKAQKIVAGDISKFGSKYILAIKIIDLQSSLTEFSVENKCACSEDQLDQLVEMAAIQIRNHFGENLPVPSLPQAGGQAFLPAASSPQGAQAPPPGGQAFLPVQRPAPQPGEFYLPNTKGGPMVLVSDFKFYIDKFEVTNQDYQECVSGGGCRDNQKYDGFTSPTQPVVGVDQNDARTYCQWAGKKLPTEDQWTKAAQGADGRTYPWGNQAPDCNLANYSKCGIKRTLPVGSKPAGVSPYGALDMAGNVWEWVEEKGVLRGGSWYTLAAGLRVTYRYRGNASDRNYNFGFRCARD